MVTKRGALLLNRPAGEFIRRAKGSADNQNFFCRCTMPEPISAAYDAMVTSCGCDDGNAHPVKLTILYLKRQYLGATACCSTLGGCSAYIFLRCPPP